MDVAPFGDSAALLTAFAAEGTCVCRVFQAARRDGEDR
jgi:hypothetical protein